MPAVVRLDSLGTHRACCRGRACLGLALGMGGIAASWAWAGIDPWVVAVAWLPCTVLSGLWLTGIARARLLLERWTWGFGAVAGAEVIRRDVVDPPLANRGSVWLELALVLLVFVAWRTIGRHRHPTWRT